MKIPNEINKLPMEQVENLCLQPIKSNSDGGFPVGFNSMEVGRN